jgi:hypothetical protein
MTEQSAIARADWCSTLRGLISRCEEDALVFRSEAAGLDGGGRQLGEVADERDDYATELGRALDRMQGRRAVFRMPFTGMLVLARQLRRVLVGANRGDAYGICIKSAARTEEVYRAALEASLPPHLASVVERQHDLVSSGREFLVQSRLALP